MYIVAACESDEDLLGFRLAVPNLNLLLCINLLKDFDGVSDGYTVSLMLCFDSKLKFGSSDLDPAEQN